MNLNVLDLTLKLKIFAGLRIVFLSITFLFTPIQLIQFFHWKFFTNMRSTITQLSKDSINYDAKLEENKVRPKVAIILHVFYPDIGIEILEQILPISNSFDKILVTHCMTQDVFTEFQNNLPEELLSKCHFMIVENRFRDSGPLIQAASSLYLSDCEVFLKLHTKKSPHLPNDEGQLWRQDLVIGLLNPKNIETLINRLAADPGPLWACPERWISVKSQWGFNSFQVWKLTRRLGIPFQGPQPFPVGNMYWFNKSIIWYIRKLSNGEIFMGYQHNISNLKDGSVCHALERVQSQLSLPYLP